MAAPAADEKKSSSSSSGGNDNRDLSLAQEGMMNYADPSLYAGRYKLVKQIGKGAYGAVYAALEYFPGTSIPPRKVAIKHIVNAFVTPTDARRIYREIKVQAHFSPSHPNILPLLEVIKPRDASGFTHIYLVSELMETDLHRVVHSRQDLTSDHISYFIYQTLCALKVIHAAHILHRDLKPSNLLVNSDCSLKMCDFGLARESDSSLSQAFTEYVVTRWYRAPEVLLSGGRYTGSIDVWSVGCILGELLLRRPLFPGEHYLHQLQLITEILGSPTEEDLAFVTAPAARTFMLNLPQCQGVPFSTLFPHVRGPCLDLLRKMLIFDPQKRCTVEEALAHPFLARVRTARRGVSEDSHPTPKPFRIRVSGGSSALKLMPVETLKARFYAELCGLALTPTPTGAPPGFGEGGSLFGPPTLGGGGGGGDAYTNYPGAPPPAAPAPAASVLGSPPKMGAAPSPSKGGSTAASAATSAASTSASAAASAIAAAASLPRAGSAGHISITGGVGGPPPPRGALLAPRGPPMGSSPHMTGGGAGAGPTSTLSGLRGLPRGLPGSSPMMGGLPLPSSKQLPGTMASPPPRGPPPTTSPYPSDFNGNPGAVAPRYVMQGGGTTTAGGAGNSGAASVLKGGGEGGVGGGKGVPPPSADFIRSRYGMGSTTSALAGAAATAAGGGSGGVSRSGSHDEEDDDENPFGDGDEDDEEDDDEEYFEEEGDEEGGIAPKSNTAAAANTDFPTTGSFPRPAGVPFNGMFPGGVKNGGGGGGGGGGGATAPVVPSSVIGSPSSSGSIGAATSSPSTSLARTRALEFMAQYSKGGAGGANPPK